MSFYQEMAGVSVDLLTEFGQPATLLSGNGGTRDKWGHILAPPTPYDCTVALFDIEAGERAGNAIEDAEQIALIAPNVEIEPKTDDKISVDGFDWQVMKVEKVSPAGIAVLYEAYVKGGNHGA